MHYFHIKQPPVHPILLLVDCINKRMLAAISNRTTEYVITKQICRYLLVCRGSDSLLFVRLMGAAKLTPIFLQSKSSATGSTVTYSEIYQAAADNLSAHQVSLGNFSDAEVPGVQVNWACRCMQEQCYMHHYACLIFVQQVEQLQACAA